MSKQREVKPISGTGGKIRYQGFTLVIVIFRCTTKVDDNKKFPFECFSAHCDFLRTVFRFITITESLTFFVDTFSKEPSLYGKKCLILELFKGTSQFLDNFKKNNETAPG